MNRDEKAGVIADIAAQIEGSEAIFAIDYRGISVPQAAALRTDLRAADASFRIVKNRLTKLAADKAGREELKDLLEGPTALAFIRGDTAIAAKAISTFYREHHILSFKGGYMDGLALDQETFTSIARLPSRDVLNGQFAGVVASPLTGLVRGLGSMVSGLAIALQQIAEQGLVSGEAPAEDPEPETAAEEAEPQPDADRDTPGSGAEDVSGSDSDAPAAGPVAEEDSSSSQAAGEELTPAPPAEDASEPPAEPEAAEPQPANDPDTPGSAAEDVSGSNAEDMAGSDVEASNEQE